MKREETDDMTENRLQDKKKNVSRKKAKVKR